MSGRSPRWLALLGVVGAGMLVPAALPAETAACLECHADKGHEIEFAEGGRVEAYVDEERFKASVHSFLACTDCHDRELTGTGHERRRFRSEELLKLRYSSACRRCHRDEAIAGLEVHARLLEQQASGQVPVCTDCHPPHSIKPVVGGRALAGAAGHCGDCHSGQARAMASEAQRPQARAQLGNVHRQLTCADCHAGYSPQSHPGGLAAGIPPGAARQELCRACHADLYARASESVHEKIRRRPEGMPDCIDCHGSHRIVPLSHDRPASAATCGGCHEKLYAAYLTSVHGDALVHADSRDVPACIDCHRVHDTDDPRTADYRMEIPFMCGNCHGNESVVGKYGLSTDVVRTYLADFHGTTVSIYRELGASTPRPGRPVAVCTDCHGTHDIKSIAALAPAEVKALLLRKCRQCHADATPNFPDAWLSHYTPSLSHAPALFVVGWAYKLLLPLMLFGMLLHVVLHARHYVSASVKARPGGAAADARRGDKARIRRFSTGRIVEHLALIVLVLLLAATGLAQQFHQAAVAQWFLSTVGGIEVARLVHRCAGAGLAALLLVHVVVNVAGITFGGWRLSMLNTPRDLRDAIQDVRYGLGVERRPADRGRYDYMEKFTYWLMLIVLATMVLSGLALWFPAAATQYLPGETIPLAVLLHSRQALVVLLLGCAWHVYDAIFSPDAFPMDTSIFTGYTTRGRDRTSD